MSDEECQRGKSWQNGGHFICIKANPSARCEYYESATKLTMLGMILPSELKSWPQV